MSATPLTLLKLCVCFLHDMRMCMWFAYNCCINFCQFSPFIYRLCEHIPYNTIPTLLPIAEVDVAPVPPPPPGGRCDTALRGIMVMLLVLPTKCHRGGKNRCPTGNRTQGFSLSVRQLSNLAIWPNSDNFVLLNKIRPRICSEERTNNKTCTF